MIEPFETRLRRFLQRCSGGAFRRRDVQKRAGDLLRELDLLAAAGHLPAPVAGDPGVVYCPHCSMPRRPLRFDGEIWSCGNCRSWFHPETLIEPALAPLFRQGGPAGYDPETGFEADEPEAPSPRCGERAGG